MAKAKVLIVEDDGIVAMHIQGRLKSLGFDVSGIVPSGEEAVRQAKETRPDIVLMDIRLEGEMDGIEAADQIRTQFNLPVVYLTAYTEDKVFKRAKITEPFGYIIKPFRDRELHSSIEIALYKHKAEEALRESEREVRLLLDSTAEAIYGLDMNGNCTFANPACVQLLGYKGTDELIGKNMHNLIHHTRPDGSSYPIEECRIYKAFQKGERCHVDDEVLWRVDGTSFPAEYWSYPIYRNNQTVGSVVTFLDITDRRHAEEALKRSHDEMEQRVEERTAELAKANEQLLKEIEARKKANVAIQTLVESTVGKIGQDFFDNVVISICQWLGCDITILGKIVNDSSVKALAMHVDGEITHDYKYLLAGTPCENAVEKGFCHYSENVVELFPEDKALQELEVSGYIGISIKDKHGRAIGVLNGLSRQKLHLPEQAEDVMNIIVAKAAAEIERKEAEEEQRLQSEVAANMAEGVYLIRVSDGVILYTNPKFEEMFGYDPSEMVGKCVTIVNALTETTPEETVDHIVGIMKQTGVWQGEIQNIKKNGAPFWCYASASIFEHPEYGEIIVSVHTDIDERKRTEEVLQEREEEKKKLEALLQQAQKMEAIGTLAGGIAHDFNNILFPMMGFAEMSLDDLQEESSVRNNIKQILQGTKRAGDLVKQILAFSRQSDQKPKPLKVQFIIKEVLKLIRSSLPSTIEIKQHISNKCGLVMADATQIHQVAMNLMTNAFQAMEDEGGKLEVTLKEVELGVDDLTDPSMTPGAYVCLTMADTGPGMDQSVISCVFEPYFTTKENGKGTGLGLAVVHGIVKSFNGDIKVYSEPGEGTAFHVYLPVIKSQFETEETEAITPVLKGTERILLVDDEDPIICMETQMLERLGYQVTARTSSTDALEAFRASPGKFDLVITDMTMPNMTGIQLSQKLLEIKPGIPILICTGFSKKIDDAKATTAGIRGYVMKPVVMRELAKKIREVLDEPIGDL